MVKHGIVLVLPYTVISMQFDVVLPQTGFPKQMVEHADDRVSTLPCATSFIYQVVDLPGDAFAAYAKDGTLSWRKKANRARLEGIVWVVDLLCHVE